MRSGVGAFCPRSRRVGARLVDFAPRRELVDVAFFALCFVTGVLVVVEKAADAPNPDRDRVSRVRCAAFNIRCIFFSPWLETEIDPPSFIPGLLLESSIVSGLRPEPRRAGRRSARDRYPGGAEP